MKENNENIVLYRENMTISEIDYVVSEINKMFPETKEYMTDAVSFSKNGYMFVKEQINQSFSRGRNISSPYNISLMIERARELIHA